MILYVYADLLPYFAKCRSERTLKFIVESSDAYGKGDTYTGEVNEEGKATGRGEVTTWSGKIVTKLIGTFLNGMAEGIIVKKTKDTKAYEEPPPGEGASMRTDIE